MENINWKYVKNLQSVESISVFEKMIGCNIPEDIKNCIIKYNGGRPDKKVYNTDLTKERTIKSLLSYNINDLETVYDAYNAVSKSNDNLVPVASDPAGNYICFNKRNQKIVLWLHETDAEESVADTFTDFLNKLY